MDRIRTLTSNLFQKLARITHPKVKLNADDAERIVHQAYWSVLGRQVDQPSLRAWQAWLENGKRSANDLFTTLGNSSELAARVQHAASAPIKTKQLTDEMIDVKTLMRDADVPKLLALADDYYKMSKTDIDHLLAKPFAEIPEIATYLISFGHLVRDLQLQRGLRVLDFGAGTGWTSRWLSMSGCEVIVSDVSTEALSIAKENYDRLGFTNFPAPIFLHFDGFSINLPDASVDRISCYDAFHHVPNPEIVLAELSRVLKSGGVACFVEPGPEHSLSSQSQFEMRNYGVIENDVDIEIIWSWAQNAGFTEIEMSAYTTAEPHMDLPQFYDLLAGGAALSRHAENVRQQAKEHRNYILYKGPRPSFDSQVREGLNGTVSITSFTNKDGIFSAECKVENTGANNWLPSGNEIGSVNIGVHLHYANGRSDRDFARIPIISEKVSMHTEDTTKFSFELTVPNDAIALDFDLVSERVCWFELNGATPCHVDLQQ